MAKGKRLKIKDYVFIAEHWDGSSVATIAKQLEISTNTVYNAANAMHRLEDSICRPKVRVYETNEQRIKEAVKYFISGV